MADAFAAPLNVFDGYITAEEQRLHQELAAAHKATEREWLRANEIQAQASKPPGAHAQAVLQAELDGIRQQNLAATRPRAR